MFRIIGLSCVVLLAGCNPIPTPNDGGVTGGGSSGGGTAGSGTGGGAAQVLVVDPGATIGDLAQTADTVFFISTTGGQSAIKSARVVNGAVVLATLCTTADTLASLVVRGTTLHAITVGVLGPGKIITTTTTSTGGACQELGAVTPFLITTLARAQNTLAYLSNPATRIGAFDLGTNTDSTLATDNAGTQVDSDGTSFFFVTPGPGNVSLVRTDAAGANRVTYATFATVVQAGFVISGQRIIWIQGDNFVSAPTTGTPGTPTVLRPTNFANANALTFCGSSDTEFGYHIDRGTSNGWYAVTVASPATAARPTDQYPSAQGCALTPGSYWWVSNDNVLRVIGR